jgi:hypothetical protein
LKGSSGGEGKAATPESTAEMPQLDPITKLVVEQLAAKAVWALNL